MRFLISNLLFILCSYHSLFASQCQLSEELISYTREPSIRIFNKTQEQLTLYLFYCTAEVSSTESIESMLYCSEILTEHFKNIQKSYFSTILTSKDVPLKQPLKSKSFNRDHSSASHIGYETYELPVGKTILIPIERAQTQTKPGSSIKYYLGDKIFILATRGDNAPCLNKQSPNSYIGSNQYTGDWARMNIDNHYFTQYLPWLVSSPLLSGLNRALSVFGAYSGWLDPQKLYQSNTDVTLLIDNYNNVQVSDLPEDDGPFEVSPKIKDYCSMKIHADMIGPEDISPFFMEK